MQGRTGHMIIYFYLNGTTSAAFVRDLVTISNSRWSIIMSVCK